VTDAAPRFCTECGRPVDESGQCPVHGSTPALAAPEPERQQARHNSRTLVLGALAVVVAAALMTALIGIDVGQGRRNRRVTAALAKVDQRLEAQTAAANGLSRRLGAMETRLNAQPDPAAVAKTAGASVFTVEAGDSLGSSFVLQSSGNSSSLVTNFHVVADEWNAGRRKVRLRQEGKDLEATIDRISKASDVAVLVTNASLPVLTKASAQPAVGDSVLVLGAPLGLGGSVSNGIVSAFRDGYIQFSAPIAPGNSGGPLVNLQGQVIGVARSKLVVTGAEGLSFAIPIAIVCTSVSVC
jgi:putative serine protease PepD